MCALVCASRVAHGEARRLGGRHRQTGTRPACRPAAAARTAAASASTRNATVTATPNDDATLDVLQGHRARGYGSRLRHSGGSQYRNLFSQLYEGAFPCRSAIGIGGGLPMLKKAVGSLRRARFLQEAPRIVSCVPTSSLATLAAGRVGRNTVARWRAAETAGAVDESDMPSVKPPSAKPLLSRICRNIYSVGAVCSLRFNSSSS